MFSHWPAVVPREVVSQWVKEPHLIPDPILQDQVKHVSDHTAPIIITATHCSLQCIVNDTNYGPLAENLKQYPHKIYKQTSITCYRMLHLNVITNQLHRI